MLQIKHLLERTVSMNGSDLHLKTDTGKTYIRIYGHLHEMEDVPHFTPQEFSDANWHFVSLQFLLRPLLEHQASDVSRIENCVAQLAGDREAREIAEEALGSARAHLELLEGLVNSETGS